MRTVSAANKEKNSIKVFNVKPYLDENDEYVELWQDIDNPKRYFGRLTFYGGEWYIVSDPLGYCELSHPCPENYTFRIHDADETYLFDSSNRVNSIQPLTTNEAINQAIKNMDTSEINFKSQELNDYILSYLTPELEKELYSQGLYCVKDNFRDFWHDMRYGEILDSFNHLGKNYYIWKIRYKHKFADFEWYEYLVGDADFIDSIYPNCYKWLGWSKIEKGE